MAARAARGGLRDVGQPTEHSGSQIPADQPDEGRHRFWLTGQLFKNWAQLDR